MNKKLMLAAMISTIGMLTACGGGGGGGGDSGTSSTTTGGTTTPPAPVTTATSDLTGDCTGVGCGASSATAYAATGTGIWSYTNNTGADKIVNVGVSNLNNNNVSLVLTNPTNTAATLASGYDGGIATTVNMSEFTPMASMMEEVPHTESEQAKYISSFNHDFKGHLQNLRKYALAYNQVNVQPVKTAFNIGDTTSFKTTDTGSYSPVATTLKAKGTASNGANVYIWVRTSEIAKLNQATIDNLLADYATGTENILTNVLANIGDYWGNQVAAGNQSMLLDMTEKDIHIVVSNLTPDNQPFGTIGYFWALNNIKSSVHPASNGKLMFFVDSETLAYSQNEGKASTGYVTVVTTLAHETQHMNHFYYKNAINDVQADTWEDELASVMAEELIGSKILGSNNIVTRSGGRFAGWLNATQCEIGYWYGNTAASNGCTLYSSYNTHAAFGAYLQRNYGTNFLKQYVQSAATGKVALDAVIKTYNANDSFESAVSKFNVSAYVNDPVSGYGFPAVSGNGVSLPMLQPSTYYPSMKSYTTLPASIPAYGSVAQLLGKKSGVYQGAITVPNGVKVTLVVK